MKLLFTLLCFALISFSCKKKKTVVEEPPIPSVRTENLDISYASKSAAQKLDLFLPSTGKASYPVVVWVHGGGWKEGDKSQFKSTSRFKDLIANDYAVISVNYRLSGEAKFPAQINDVKAAVRWIRANAVAYNLNPNKIGIWGSSAGGHLSALAGTSTGESGLEDLSLGNSNFSSKVQAVIDWYGPTDFLKMDSMALANGCAGSSHNGAFSPESELLGVQITKAADLVRAANPITYISHDDPPFYIFHGTSDCTVAFKQSQLLYDKLVPVLGTSKVKIKLLSDTGHGGGIFETQAINMDAINFLNIYLK